MSGEAFIPSHVPCFNGVVVCFNYCSMQLISTVVTRVTIRLVCSLRFKSNRNSFADTIEFLLVSVPVTQLSLLMVPMSKRRHMCFLPTAGVRLVFRTTFRFL